MARRRGEPPRCEVVVSDDGPAFDPLAAAAPDTSLGVEERPIGGLGIALVRRLMDEVEYERRDGRNHLRLAPAARPDGGVRRTRMRIGEERTAAGAGDRARRGASTR